MFRVLRLGTVVALLAVWTTGTASATTAHISPSSQTHAYSVASTWTASWTGGAPFVAELHHGDGTSHQWITNSLSKSDSYAYFPCVSTHYDVELDVLDTNFNGAVGFASTREGGGPSC